MAAEKKIDYVILGLLSHESLTGYEMKKRMDLMLQFFYHASFGSIYPALILLEKEAKVTKEKELSGRREKITYTITDKGRASLEEWLKVPVKKDELRSETLLKLFFGSEVGTDMCIKHITGFQKRVEENLFSVYKSIENLKRADGRGSHQYYLLTALFGKKIYEACLEWCEEAEQLLEEEKYETL